MLEADRGTAVVPGFWRPERKAWAILLGAFVIFCALASVVTYTGYRYAAASDLPMMVARTVQPHVVFRQPAGFVRREILDENGPIGPGDRVIVSPEGPSGIGARLLLRNAAVALWPGTSVLVEEGPYDSLRVSLEEGQIVLDVRGNGPSLFVASASLPQEVELTAPGRYRLRKFTQDQTTTALSEQGLAPRVELAADAGLARMGETGVEAGARLITGAGSQPERNHWTLLRDGDFTAFSADEYRATLRTETDVPKASTWSVTQQPLAEGAVWQSGLFFLREECNSRPGDAARCRNIARLARLGGNQKDSITGIAQEIAADVTAYDKVMLEADVRIDYQSLSKGGADGSECPLFAQVLYTNERSRDLQLDFCFWAFDYGSGNISVQPWIVSQRIQPQTWYPFRADLRALIPDLREVQRVTFFANGHDYDASVADVSLWAQGLAEVREQ
ncbi:MAG TPA: hypothetical protein VLA19_31050 [Herpetosiphonaceae bacterium]|nr:hypothetical protein [Herpetosiphonaceae bacterium]